MPRLEVRVLRENYHLLGRELRGDITFALNGVAAINLELSNSDISVEWICVEEGINMATLTVDIIYTTGEYEAPHIRERMPKVFNRIRETLQQKAQFFPKGMDRTTAGWQTPRPDARYEEDTAA